MTGPAVVAEDLSAGYGGRPVLREVSFAAAAGQTVCVLGPNGGGKTTLFRLLSTLIRRRGRVLTREQLIAEAWGPHTYIGDRVVDTHILNLRKKVEPVPQEPRFLRSVRGMGYRFDG